MSTLPTLFVSHGAPDVALADTPATRFLAALGSGMPRPRAIVVVTAHYEAEGEVRASADPKPATVHDFSGFDPRLSQIVYPAPGEPSVARSVVQRLVDAGFAARLDTERGFDHGTWVPLSLIYPEADIPVVQVSVDPTKGPEHHYALGRALEPLRTHDILIVGSGCLTHNLTEAFGHIRAGERQAATPEWVSEFAEWVARRVVKGERDALMDYREQAPFAVQNHPSEEHIMPLFVAMGAAGREAEGRRLHDSVDYGVLSMAAFAFS